MPLTRVTVLPPRPFFSRRTTSLWGKRLAGGAGRGSADVRWAGVGVGRGAAPNNEAKGLFFGPSSGEGNGLVILFFLATAAKVALPPHS